MPDEEYELGDPYSFATSVDDPELAADLIKGYENPEVFSDPSLTQIYRTRIFQTTRYYSNHPPHDADVIYAQLNGHTLPFALRESMFWMMVRSPNLAETMQAYEVKTFADLRTAMQNDPEFAETDQRMGLFFIRNFPKLLLSMYEILAVMSVSAAVAADVDDQKQKDELLRAILKQRLRQLGDQIKAMVGTRRRGGSKGKLEVSTRRSMHAQYDEILQIGKAIKRHYNEVFRTFDKSRQTYKRETWEEFWLSHAKALYDYNPDFLSLFSELGDPSASDVAYKWLALHTGHSLSYIKRLVIQSRKQKK